MTLKRAPTPAERAILECARALDRLELELARYCQTIERLELRLEIFERRLETLERQDNWIESFRSDEHALEALRSL